MDEIEVPPYFLCPISLQIMKDPVTISTGITYDREAIEKWIISEKNNACPVTKQALLDTDLTPNIILRRLIQSWCDINASHGVKRFPTPKPPVSRAQIAKLLNDAKSPKSQIKCLTKLRSIASENETNKRCVESAGGIEFLASIIKNSNQTPPPAEEEEGFERSRASDEALSILHHLQLSETGLKSLFDIGGEFLESLMRIMLSGNFEPRRYAINLTKSMFEVADPMQMNALRTEFFVGIVQVLQDQFSSQATKAALQLLINICPWGRNRIKAVEAGAVSVLVDHILYSIERRRCEMLLTVLDQLTQCAEGRAELLKHGAGLAAVSKKILRVSRVGSEKALRILLSISKFSATTSVVQEMLHVGVVAKLCMVLQVDCDCKTKERAREILKLHARSWRNSPCVPMNLLASYPS